MLDNFLDGLDELLECVAFFEFSNEHCIWLSIWLWIFYVINSRFKNRIIINGPTHTTIKNQAITIAIVI